MKASFRTRIILPLLVLAAFAAGLPGCTSDPEMADQTHYFNPVWSTDGKKVLAGYEHLAGGAVHANNLALRIVDGGAQNLFTIPAFNARNRMFMTPGGQCALVTTDGLSFISLDDGQTLGSVGMSALGVKPSILDFLPGSTSMYYLAGRDEASGRVVIGLAQYASVPWQLTNMQVLKDTVTASALLDVVYTSAASFAVRFADGTVHEYSTSGAVLGTFHLRPLTIPVTSLWQTRLHFIESVPTRKLYVVEDSGLVWLNLDDKTQKLFVGGRVIGFDISRTTPFLIFETKTGDTWLATRDGQPLYRLAYQNIMPAFSANGKSVAAVARVNPARDSLHVVPFVQ